MFNILKWYYEIWIVWGEKLWTDLATVAYHFYSWRQHIKSFFSESKRVHAYSNNIIWLKLDYMKYIICIWTLKVGLFKKSVSHLKNDSPCLYPRKCPRPPRTLIHVQMLLSLTLPVDQFSRLQKPHIFTSACFQTHTTVS